MPKDVILFEILHPGPFRPFSLLKSWSSKIEFGIRTPHASRFSVQRASSLPSSREAAHCHSSLDSVSLQQCFHVTWRVWKGLLFSPHLALSLFICHAWIQQSNFAWNLSQNKFYISHTYINTHVNPTFVFILYINGKQVKEFSSLYDSILLRSKTWSTTGRNWK